MAKQHTFYPEIFRVGFQFRLDQSNCRHDQEKESKQNNFSTVSLGEPSKSFKKRLQNRPHKQSRPVPPCMALKKKKRIYHHCKNFNQKYFYSPTDPLVVSFRTPTNPKVRDQFNFSCKINEIRFTTLRFVSLINPNHFIPRYLR